MYRKIAKRNLSGEYNVFTRGGKEYKIRLRYYNESLSFSHVFYTMAII